MAYIFVDFDDTLSEETRLREQQTAEAGALFAEQFGGEAALWAQATGAALDAVKQEYEAKFVGNPLAGYSDWLETARTRTIEIIFRQLERPLPPDPDQLAKDIQFQSLSSCDATFPGAFEALEALFQADVRVQLASGNDSEYLLAALLGAGVESYTESKFGPDLVDCAKEGPEFYERIFAATGVAASETLVVDDQESALQWAMSVGAKAVQSRLVPGRAYPDVSGVVAVLTDLKALPGLVTQILG